MLFQCFICFKTALSNHLFVQSSSSNRGPFRRPRGRRRARPPSAARHAADGRGGGPKRRAPGGHRGHLGHAMGWMGGWWLGRVGK